MFILMKIKHLKRIILIYKNKKTMKKFLLILFITLFVVNVNILANHSNNNNNNNRKKSKASKKSTTAQRWNNNRKIFKMKPSNSHLSNDRKEVRLKRMY